VGFAFGLAYEYGPSIFNGLLHMFSGDWD